MHGKKSQIINFQHLCKRFFQAIFSVSFRERHLGFRFSSMSMWPALRLLGAGLYALRQSGKIWVVPQQHRLELDIVRRRTHNDNTFRDNDHRIRHDDQRIRHDDHRIRHHYNSGWWSDSNYSTSRHNCLDTTRFDVNYQCISMIFQFLFRHTTRRYYNNWSLLNSDMGLISKNVNINFAHDKILKYFYCVFFDLYSENFIAIFDNICR